MRIATCFLLLSIVLGISPARANMGPVLSYIELQALAKSAINAEVDDLNQLVMAIVGSGVDPSTLDLRGYKKGDFKIFEKFDKPEGVAPDVLYGVCALTKETVTAITSRKITKANLQVSSNLNAVYALKSMLNGKFFRIAERACLNAKERFIQRLTKATSHGETLRLDPTLIQNVASVVFFPADYAQPSLGKALLKALPFVINGALIVGTSSSLIGVKLPVIWMSVTSLTGATFSVKNLLPKPDEIFRQKDISNVEPAQGISIDLTTDEAAMK